MIKTNLLADIINTLDKNKYSIPAISWQVKYPNREIKTAIETLKDANLVEQENNKFISTAKLYKNKSYRLFKARGKMYQLVKRGNKFDVIIP